MEKSISLSKRIGRWLGLSGDHQPSPGEIRPLWHNVPKSRYLAISIPVTGAAAFLLLTLISEGVNVSFAAIFAVQSFALAMLIFERAHIKFYDEHSERKDDEVT